VGWGGVGGRLGAGWAVGDAASMCLISACVRMCVCMLYVCMNHRGNERLALGLLGVIAEHYGHILPGKDIMTPQLPDPHR
jgi:hypothetical protein